MKNAKPATTQRVVFPKAMSVEIEEVVLPPLQPTDIRIRTDSTLISTGTELSSLVGKPWKEPDGTTLPAYPAYPGYSSAGTVIETGSGVSTCTAGDRVACGANHIGIATVKADAFHWHIPHGVGFEAATFTNLSATVLNGIRLGRPQIGDAVAIIGLGIIGQMAAQFIKLCGAERVIGIDVDDFRLARGHRAGGITHAINPNALDAAQKVKDLTEGRGADVVYEATGLASTFNLAFEVARKQATVVALGSPRWPGEINLMPLHMKALRLVGAIVSSHPLPGSDANRWHKQANAELFLRLQSEGKIRMQDLISHRFDCKRAKEAFALLVNKGESVLGVIMKWNTM